MAAPRPPHTHSLSRRLTVDEFQPLETRDSFWLQAYVSSHVEESDALKPSSSGPRRAYTAPQSAEACSNESESPEGSVECLEAFVLLPPRATFVHGEKPAANPTTRRQAGYRLRQGLQVLQNAMIVHSPPEHEDAVYGQSLAGPLHQYAMVVALTGE